MKPGKGILLAVAALTAVLIPGCGERHSAKEVYYLITTNMSTNYWQTAIAGFNKAAAQDHVTAKVAGPDNYDPQAELAELKKAVATKPAGILISSADAAVLTPEINEAIAAGIPVITIDSDAAGSHRIYFIGTNNLEAGRLGGQRLVTKLGAKANVVFFTIVGQPNTDERLKGFKDVLASRPGINIVEVVDIKDNFDAAFDKAQQFLELSGAKKIDAFVCLESASGKMVADAVKRTSDKKRVVLAWDVNSSTLNEIKDGTIDSTIVQKPFTMGFVGLKALDEIYHDPPAQFGKDYSTDPFAPYPGFIDTGTSIVDKSNVDLYLAAAAAHAQ